MGSHDLIRWMCELELKQRKKMHSTQNCWYWNQSAWRLRRTDYSEYKDYADWVKLCTMMRLSVLDRQYDQERPGEVKKIWSFDFHWKDESTELEPIGQPLPGDWPLKQWMTSLFGLVRGWAFWLSPNTNLNAPLWSKSKTEIRSAELLLKIVKMASLALADSHMSSVDVQFTARLRPLRWGNISAAIAAAANIAMLNFCLRLNCSD